MSTKARPLGPSLLVVLGCCAGNKRACAAWFRSSGLHLGEHVPLVSRSSVLYPVLLLIAICLQGPRRCPGSPPQGGGAPAQVNDAYTVLLREKKLPMALLEDPEAKAAAAGKAARASLVQTQPFAATFGAKRTRKRPKLAADSLADLAASALRVNATCARAARLPDASAPARRGASSACRTRVWARAPPQACCWSAGARCRAREARPARGAPLHRSAQAPARARQVCGEGRAGVRGGGGGRGRRAQRGAREAVRQGPEPAHLGRAVQGGRLQRRGHPGARRPGPAAPAGRSDPEHSWGTAWR